MKKAFCFLAVISLFICCTFSTVKPKKVEIKAGEEARLEQDIKNTVIFESINVNGSKIKSNNKERAELNIEIINGQGLPDNNDELNVTGKKLAQKFKSALKDTSDFNNINVAFVTVEGNGVVSKSKRSTFKYDVSEL